MAGVGVEKFGDWGKAHEICDSMAEKFKLAADRACMQEIHFLRGEVVKYMSSGAVAALSAKTLATRAFTNFRGSKPLIRRGDYRNSIVAKHIGDAYFVGVLRTAKKADGKSLANIAELMENGGQVVVPITPKSRRFYHAAMKAAGISLDSGSHHSGGGAVIAIVKIHARPVFGPVFEKHGQTEVVRARFFARLQHIFFV